MPDSWIDKKELEELVGSFASPRKSRRKPLAPRSRGDDAPKESVPPTTETVPVEAAPVEASVEVAVEASVEASVEPILLGQDSPPAIEVVEIPTLEPEEMDPESDAIFVFEEDPGTVDGVDASVVDVLDAPVQAAPDALTEETDLGVERNEDAPPEAEAIVPKDDEPDSPPPLAESPATESPESGEADALEAPTVSVEERRPPLPVELPEIRIESAEEAFRDLPPFLDDPAEAPAPRPVSLSERDADRALIALAEARARVERSQLLRVRSIPDEPPALLPELEFESEIESEIEPVATIPLPEAGAPVEPEAASIAIADLDAPAAELESGPIGESAEPPLPESVESAPEEPASAVVEPELVPPVAPEPEEDVHGLFLGERFLRRVERFGEEARRRLDAREVIVCDRDGLILYSDVEERAGGVLETALLLEVSAKTNRLLGLSTSRATQVSVGGGLWRCLLKESGAAGDLYAGLLLPEPLEEGQIAFWTRALSEVTKVPAMATS